MGNIGVGAWCASPIVVAKLPQCSAAAEAWRGCPMAAAELDIDLPVAEAAKLGAPAPWRRPWPSSGHAWAAVAAAVAELTHTGAGAEAHPPQRNRRVRTHTPGSHGEGE